MTISPSQSSTSKLRFSASTLTTPSGLQRLSIASPNTGTLSSKPTASSESHKKSSKSKRTIKRNSFLIFQEDAGLYLGTMADGTPVWVKHPLQAMQHCHHDTALRNLYVLREYFDVPEMLGVKEVTFVAFASNPTQWFTDHV